MRPVTNQEQELDVLLTVTEDPRLSQSNIGGAVGISERSVQRILKRNHFHPYHIHEHQALFDRDIQNRFELNKK